MAKPNEKTTVGTHDVVETGSTKHQVDRLIKTGKVERTFEGTTAKVDPAEVQKAKGKLDQGNAKDY